MNESAASPASSEFPLPQPAPVPRPLDFDGCWRWFRSIGSPKFIVAPMVNQSELPFRLLTKRYGADLAYTPMLHALMFARDQNYRAEHFTTTAADRPVIAQFCSNRPDVMLAAARFVENSVDAVDLNLGCPQGIAKRGNYGSFLLESTDLICSIVSVLYQNLKVPVTCKIRILHTEEATLELARRLEASGCWLLTVHGRHRESIKDRIGPTDFEIIAKIKVALRIPVISNGSIENLRDCEEILELTKCDGVMTSEGILCDPALFSGIRRDALALAREYLTLAREYHCSSSIIRGHLFKILFRELTFFSEFRTELGTCQDENIENFLCRLEETIKAEVANRLANGLPALEIALSECPRWYRRYLSDPAVRDESVIRIRHSAERTAAKKREEITNQNTSGFEENCDFGCLLDG